MKTNILLITLTNLALLLNGCEGGGDNPVGGEINLPVVINPDSRDPKEPSNPVEPVELVEPKPPVDPYKPAGWYGKTQVSATEANGNVYSHTTAGVFGELVQSSEGKDQHDIAGYKTAIFQIVFPQTEWTDEDNGDYFSNYKHYDQNSVEKRVWVFQIKNQHTVNLANAAIRIDLKGVFDVKYKEENGRVEYKESKEVNQTILNELHLVDVDNATEYTIAQLQTANLNMNGLNTRTFRWVLGTIDQDDYAPLSKTGTVSAKVSVASVYDEADVFTTKNSGEKTGGKFGLPPQ